MALGCKRSPLTSYGFLSAYRPTRGGLAGTTAALAVELQTGTPASRVGVVRVIDRLERSTRPEVVHHLLTSAPGGEAEAAAILNSFDTVIVQHDFGMYGGPDGDQVISVLARLTVPVIVVLHAIPVAPTPHQRDVLEQVLGAADAVVTTNPADRRRLLQQYVVDSGTVFTIPHGDPADPDPGSDGPAVPLRPQEAEADRYRALAGALVAAADGAGCDQPAMA